MTGLLGAAVPAPVSFGLKAAPYAAIAILGALCWHFDARAVANADLVRTQAAQFKSAQSQADAAWTAKLSSQQATYAKQKDDAQNAYTASLDSYKSATDKFIAANILRPARPQSGSVTTVTTASEAPIAGLREEVPADPLVAVKSSDVQACSITTDYALQLRDWAISVTR